MPGIRATDGRARPDDLAVNEPRQRRTREQWQRVLDAGVRLLEEGGYEAFTIAALCARARVPPRALYARAGTKDALFLAVYEHGMTSVLTSHDVFRDEARWAALDDQQRVEQAVADLVRTFTDHADFLRAVVLISGAHPEVRQRGAAYREALGVHFAEVLPPVATQTRRGRADPDAAHQLCFSVVFSAMVVRTAYGPGFGLAGEEDLLAAELAAMVGRYLGVAGRDERARPIRTGRGR